MGFKQHISRTWQMIEQQVNDVPFRPHHEAAGLSTFTPADPTKACRVSLSIPMKKDYDTKNVIVLFVMYCVLET